VPSLRNLLPFTFNVSRLTSRRAEMGSPLLKGEFWPLAGGKVGPALLLVLVETAEECHVAIERAKLGERDRTVRHIDDAGIELANHVEQTRSRLIEIPSARISRIGEQLR